MNYNSLTHFHNNNSETNKNSLLPAYDWNDFVCDLQEMYNEFKKMSGEMTQRTRHVLGEKFSGTFQSKYAQLSVKFDTLIERAETRFDSHREVLQDSQQHVSQLLAILPVEQCYGHLLTIVSQLLLSSQSLYREYIKQEVFTIKQELETIVIKNYQLQQEITRVYQSYEQVKQRLDEEMNYRFQLEKHLVGLEKEIQFIKEENYQLNKVNKSLVKSKHDLDQEVQVTKLQHKILKKSQLQKYDKLKQQQTKTLQLEKQIDTLHHQIFTLQHQLQDSKNQQQNFIEEIKHLTEIIDNQSYELQFYKNRELRESPSTKMQSIDKLHKYQDLVLQNYYPQQSSEKSSLRSFMLSHQKSMGKLTIFQTRQQHQQRGLQKITSCQKSLHSFQKDKHFNNYEIDNTLERDIERSINMLGFGFPLLNQMTFRPGKENDMREEDIRWTQKRKEQKNYRQEEQIILTQPQQQVQIARNYVQVLSPQQMRYPKTSQDYPYIEPLVISGRKHAHSRQRSLSITEGYPSSTSFSVSKKLLYESDQVPESGSNEDKDRIQQFQMGQDNNDEGSIVDEMGKGEFQGQQDKQVKIKNVKQHKSNNVSSLIESQKPYNNESKNKPVSVHMNSNFYYTRRKQPQRESNFPPLIKKRLLARSQSKQEFHQSQPINISELLYNINKGQERNNDNKGQQSYDERVKNSNKNINKNIYNDNSRVNIKISNNTSNTNNNYFNASFNHNNNNNNFNHPYISSNNNSRIQIIAPIQQWDNRSETNSVNRALIKKNIKAQKEMDQLIQRLQKAQIKIDQQQQSMNELQSKLKYYRQELNRTSIQSISYKSSIQSLQAQIVLLQNNLAQMENNLKDKDILLQRKSIYIQQLLQQIEQHNERVQQIQLKYQQRLIKVKGYCKQYIEKKHQQEIGSITQCYQQEIKELARQVQRLSTQVQKLQESNGQLQKQKNLLQKESQNLSLQKETLKYLNIERQQLIVKQQERITQLTQSIVKLQRQRISLQKKLTKQQQERIRLEQQLQSINKLKQEQKQINITSDIGIQTDECHHISDLQNKNNKLYQGILDVCIQPSLLHQQIVIYQEKEKRQLSIQTKLIDITLLLQSNKRKSKLQLNKYPYQCVNVIGTKQYNRSNQQKDINQLKQLKQVKQSKQLSISSQLISISLLSQTKNATLSSSQQALIIQQSSFIKNNHQDNHQQDYHQDNHMQQYIDKLSINCNLYSITINHQKQQKAQNILKDIKQLPSPSIPLDYNNALKTHKNNYPSSSLSLSNNNKHNYLSSQQINIKSPSLQKKQPLLNTPSTQSYLQQTYKPTTIKSQQQQQQQHLLQQQQNESFHTVQFIAINNNNNKNNKDKYQQSNEQSSSSLISSYKNRQQIQFSKQLIQGQQMDSFFTCIQFYNSSLPQINMSHSFITNNKHYSDIKINTRQNSDMKINTMQQSDIKINIKHQSDMQIKSCQQQIIPKDIFMVKNHTYTENNISQNIQPSIQKQIPSYNVQQEQMEQKQHNLKQIIAINKQQLIHKDHYEQQMQTHNQHKQSIQLSNIFNPTKINQFQQIQQPPIINRSRASSKHLKKPKQPYFKISLNKEISYQNLQNQQHFYSKSFQKHFTSYFKKHTHFLFSHQLQTQLFVPDIQKIYLLNVSKVGEDNDSDKQNLQNLQNNNRFLLYKRLLVNLQNDHKLQLPKSSMLKFIKDENKLVLGNFQIIISSDQQLKITRKNKRSFYMGELQDSTWKINSVQEITTLAHSHKKQNKN